jgi:LuxR family transcriptional regulator, maltose regulon positive regulatory protein
MSALNPNRLLHTKLMPPRLPAIVVPRQELLARLDAVMTKKMGLVTAPTGFGKTTLVRMWIASHAFSFAWAILDDHDRSNSSRQRQDRC